MDPEPVSSQRLDRRLQAALTLAAVFHGTLLVAGTFRRTYDAYVHLFFADHYARDWFSTWDNRWYTGFTTTSYPPGTHQVVGAISHLIGLQPAFVVVQLASVLLLVVGVYRFSRLWVSPDAAGWAALLAAVSSSIALTVHAFGQLPTTFSLALLLNATPFVSAWVRHGAPADLGRAVIVTGATTAGHHVTTLFGTVFFLGPVIAAAVIDAFRTPLEDESTARPVALARGTLAALVARRLRRCLPALARSALYGASVIGVLVIVVLPYWVWSRRDPISQIPIPHASRDDFLQNLDAGLVFWLIPWGALLVVLPFALLRGLLGSAWPLALSVALLALLGTGGTTPLPRLLLGGAYDILTLDRFTFWATIAVLPLAGWFVQSLVAGRIRAAMTADFGTTATRVALGVGALGLLGTAVFSANIASLRPFQPDPIDMDPIVEFLTKDQHERWRYLTLGFGDQMAWLSTQTEATTVDGNYHSVRRLPELTTTPVERLEGAKFRGIPGIGSLQQFLAVPAKYHLKFVFSNDEFYDPLLWSSGWHRIERLANGIVVWEREDVPPLPPDLPVNEISLPMRALWGVVPMASIAGASLVLAGAALRPSRTQPRRPHWSGVPVRSFVGHLDVRLEHATHAITDGPQARPRWQPLARAAAMSRNVLTPEPSRWRRAVVATTVAAGAIACAMTLGDAPAGPDDVVEAFYDDLDFRRIRAAHDRLDPVTRPGFVQFELERSIEDGLVATYAKLDSIRTEIVERDGLHATVHVELDYVTALDGHRRTVTHRLVNRDGEWFIEPNTPDLAIPPAQFVRRADVDFLSQGRRRATTGTTAYADVIDRPEVVTTQARLVRFDQRWVVVGEIVNTDVDPADVTVTAQLLASDGRVLAQYDASQVIAHKLLPKESTPFLIEFEGIAGALDVLDPTAGDFDPAARTPLEIVDADVASFSVYTKAVVTGRDLDRSLVAQDVRIEREGDAWWLVGSLRNDGPETVTIPHLLVGHRNRDAELLWVDHAFVDEAIRPQRSQPFRIGLSDLDGWSDSALPGATFDNGLGSEPATSMLHRLDVDHPIVDHLTVSVIGFVRVTT